MDETGQKKNSPKTSFESHFQAKDTTNQATVQALYELKMKKSGVSTADFID